MIYLPPTTQLVTHEGKCGRKVPNWFFLCKENSRISSSGLCRKLGEKDGNDKDLPPRQLTYFTWGEGKSSWKVLLKGDMLVPRNVRPVRSCFFIVYLRGGERHLKWIYVGEFHPEFFWRNSWFCSESCRHGSVSSEHIWAECCVHQVWTLSNHQVVVFHLKSLHWSFMLWLSLRLKEVWHENKQLIILGMIYKHIVSNISWLDVGKVVFGFVILFPLLLIESCVEWAGWGAHVSMKQNMCFSNLVADSMLLNDFPKCTNGWWIKLHLELPMNS